MIIKYVDKIWDVKSVFFNDKHYLTTYGIKIVRIKQKRRNKMYNDSHNESY